MYKKIVCLTLAVVLILTFAVGCGGNNASSETTTAATTVAQTSATTAAPETEKKLDPVKLTFSHSQGEWMWPVLEDIGKKYQEKSGNSLEFVYIPGGQEYDDWTRTQFAGGTAPDIIWGGMDKNKASDYLKNKWIVDLKPYFEETSPYTGAAWKDAFLPGVLEGVTDANIGDAMLGVPILMVTVNLYYNKAMFAEAGLPDKAPENWTEVLEACKKVKAVNKDYIGFSLQNSFFWNLGWMEVNVMKDLWDDVVDRLDVINPNGLLEVSEQALGIKAGVIDPADPRMVDYYRYMKEFRNYFNKGFNAASWEFEKLFNEGKSAMTLNGSWFPNQDLVNKYPVEYGVGPVPYIDKAISPSTPGVLRKYVIGPGGLPESIVLTQKSIDDGRFDAALDFARFMTDPNTGAKMFVDASMFLPSVKGVDVPVELKGISDAIGTDPLRIKDWHMQNFSAEHSDKYKVMFQKFLEDDQSPEAFVKALKPVVLKYCDQTIKEHPEWKIDEYLDKVKK